MSCQARVIVAGTDYYGHMEQIAHGFQKAGCSTTVIPCYRPTRFVNIRKQILYVRLPMLGFSYFLERAWANVRRRFRQQLLAQEFDLMLVLRPEILTPELITEIRAKKPHAQLTTWLVDPLASMHGLNPILPLLDHVFTYNAEDLPRLRPLIGNAHTLLGAYDTDAFAPACVEASDSPRWQLSFVGALDARRIEILERLCQHLALAPDDLRIFTGKDTWLQRFIYRRKRRRRSWLHRRGMFIHETVDATQACRLYQQSALCLNIHRVDAERGYNLRLFEIAGAGGFQLTDRVPGIEACFEEGSEIEIYDSIDELLDKGAYYAANPNARLHIARQSARRAAAHHTFQHRAIQVLSTCSLTPGIQKA